MTVTCPVEDRLAIEDVAVAYCTAVDAIGNVDGVCTLFTQDAVYDLSSLGMGAIHGRDAIGAFFAGAFPTMAHNAHYLSNFALTSFSGETASATAYVHAWSVGTDGKSLEVKARYSFGLRRIDAGWKIGRFAMALLIPMSA